MDFESSLAAKIASRDKRRGVRAWCPYAGLVGAVFVVLTLASATMAAPQVSVHIGSQTSVARYIGLLDYSANVIEMGVQDAGDSVSIMIQFNGRFSELEAISFSEFVIQAGGDPTLEPCTFIKFAEGDTLVCCPRNSYSDGWYQPNAEWQTRDVVSQGRWALQISDGESLVAGLETWLDLLGDREVTMIGLFIGGWDLPSPFHCYVGDFAINGKVASLGNAKRCVGPSTDVPLGFF